MQKNHIYLSVLLLLLVGLCLLVGQTAHAQAENGYEGSFQNDSYGTTLTLRKVQGTYTGVLSTGYMNFEVVAKQINGKLEGQVFHGPGNPIPWKGWMRGKQLMVEAYGGSMPM